MIKNGYDFDDPLNLWGCLMASIAHKLLIKYGLAHTPTETQALEWTQRTQRLIQLGVAQDAAGEQSAKALFPDYRTRIYASEADTIEMLLREAGRR